MEERIQQQREVIAGLRAHGEASTAATTRLALMTRALEEMQFQLGSLSPSEQERKAPPTAQPSVAPAGKK